MPLTGLALRNATPRDKSVHPLLESTFTLRAFGAPVVCGAGAIKLAARQDNSDLTVDRPRPWPPARQKQEQTERLLVGAGDPNHRARAGRSSPPRSACVRAGAEGFQSHTSERFL